MKGIEKALVKIKDKSAGSKTGIAGEIGLDADEVALGDQKKKQSDPLKEVLVGGKHPLTGVMSSIRTRFFFVKAPSLEFLALGIRTSQWALT
jgi:hypothetical protein